MKVNSTILISTQKSKVVVNTPALCKLQIFSNSKVYLSKTKKDKFINLIMKLFLIFSFIFNQVNRSLSLQ